MEIESLFLFDASHFEKIDSRLINSLIVTTTGFDPENENPEDVTKPSDLLRDIYRIAHKTYKKTRNQVERTVDMLDYEYLYLHARDTLTHSSRVLGHLDDFF